MGCRNDTGGPTGGPAGDADETSVRYGKCRGEVSGTERSPTQSGPRPTSGEPIGLQCLGHNR